ncbi:flagellar biosynthesis protein FlhF [Nitrosomonas cryotolerans]|uniref:Flagellar biosynthesis protein FlhF n=1 Tax=Nitrosomonas cryotolerans ATCC 49181 TaxID=1131553 RepID=A0A1N6IJG9_9PROT|nr:flagellar biosynthesis protein FlhF [Nitrosomonas cryotolerans]SFP93785.1 flagellar biosynthesis protein FlhF [Nitrosomonas cryotolerans]SIO32141.1 flagellar biosynthesis protein FlhF [Nitrosomonas cryotolerans ATCC 49181]
MKIRRFIAKATREALNQVKNELGADAIILSNRQTEDGVEIMALANAEISNLADMSNTNDASVESEAESPATIPPSVSNSNTRQLEYASREIVSETLAQNIIGEIHAMRTTLEDQLATVAWGNYTQQKPEKMRILRTLLGAGFSPLLSRHLVDKLSAGLDYEQSLKKTMSTLAFNLRTASSDEMIENGGIYALIGPTGVGKTTTTAKLAARCVIRHGADQVALLTTDSYRIGGHEQLRIYGKLLGVPVRTIKDSDDLQLTLSELKNKHLVLIDTVGMSQRDQMVAEQLAMLCNANLNIKHLLLLNATCSGNTLDEVISAYQGNGIHGCIITKVDEAASLGVALDVVIRRKLILHYMANGQKVPEDLHSANLRYLLHRIFKLTPENSPFALQDAEFALIMTGINSTSQDPNKTYAEANHD